MPRKIYGYEVRIPFDSELGFFKANSTVSGMATEDKKIILNPFIRLNPEQEESVLRNEATRLFLRDKKYKYDFDITPEQKEIFKDTIYGKPENENELKSTILSRALSGDPSSGTISPRQQNWVDWIRKKLEGK